MSFRRNLAGSLLGQLVCPVSYTHLDVYKRQSLNTIDEATKETISTPILHENIKALKELMTAIQTYISLEETREEHYPVSYTHLCVLSLPAS